MSARASRPSAVTSAGVWDGAALLAAVTAATEWLTVHREGVNALNVYPVPDGDTGTNMTLTMRAALDEANAADQTTQTTAGGVARRLEYGALMGARGNSGVILSQVFRGFARAIADRQEIDGRDIATGLAGAREMAYKAVMRPVEGTMLTVIRVAAERAESVARKTPALPAVLAAATDGARQALTTTPDLLDILRQAGVVDAGGQGVVYILEGLERYARGETRAAEWPADAPAPLGLAMAFLDRIDELHGDDAFGYCTNFMVFGEGIDIDRCRREMSTMGRSSVIVGDETMMKVHIHALNPGEVLDYAVQLGELGQIKIDNMQAQTRALEAERAQMLPEQSRAKDLPAPVGKRALLAVAAGDGLGGALRSMGASDVIVGGQTMNPSIEELLKAVEAAPTEEVILLPDNANILLTANQIPALTPKRVRVVPSRSVPQGLAALAVYTDDAELEANVEAMTAAMAAVRTVEVTCAVRDATISGVSVAAGHVIGLLDDELVASGEDEIFVVRAALTKAAAASAELVTVFSGDGVDDGQVEALRAAIAGDYPDISVEVYRGGQPYYRYVIGVE